MSNKEDTGRLIGKLAPEDAERDAIHIPVVPVIADEILAPGQRVVVYHRDGKLIARGPSYSLESQGVVDPYLSGYVNKGERFFLLLKPGSITSLRHVWTHSAFENVPAAPQSIDDQRILREKEVAVKWIEELAKNFDMSYAELINHATGWATGTGREHITQQNGEDWQDTFRDNMEEFWKKFELVTGINTAGVREDNFFSCYCGG